MLQKDFDEILGTELISLSGGLLAGFLLTFATGQLELIPSLFVLLPGFLEMRGNISGTLSARITSGLFVGVLKYGTTQRNIVRGNVSAAMILTVALSLFLGFMAYFVSAQFFGIINPKIIIIAVLAAVMSNVIEIPITIAATFWIFKSGRDPNNIMGPYVTTIGDIISVASLLIAIAVVTA